MFASAGLNTNSGDLILKVVNRGDKTESLDINLGGIYRKGVCTEISAASPMDENSFTQPDKIAPEVSALPACNGSSCNHAFSPYSVTVLRWSKN
jgi:alpha-L-arabinofuranosidase